MRDLYSTGTGKAARWSLQAHTPTGALLTQHEGMKSQRAERRGEYKRRPGFVNGQTTKSSSKTCQPRPRQQPADKASCRPALSSQPRPPLLCPLGGAPWQASLAPPAAPAAAGGAAVAASFRCRCCCCAGPCCCAGWSGACAPGPLALALAVLVDTTRRSSSVPNTCQGWGPKGAGTELAGASPTKQGDSALGRNTGRTHVLVTF